MFSSAVHHFGVRNSALVPRTDGLGQPPLTVGPPHGLGYQVYQRILATRATAVTLSATEVETGRNMNKSKLNLFSEQTRVRDPLSQNHRECVGTLGSQGSAVDQRAAPVFQVRRCEVRAQRFAYQPSGPGSLARYSGEFRVLHADLWVTLYGPSCIDGLLGARRPRIAAAFRMHRGSGNHL